MDRQQRLITGFAALSGLMAVAAGAFGTHGLTDPEARAWLQTGGHYQLVHAVAALSCAALERRLGRNGATAAWLFLSGGLVFSGSLYLLALDGPRILGAVTPLGGLLMILGWLLLAWTGFRAASTD
jgi:uncharacterized membrane protein YgdD (TMEM256/DUF423 family)